MKYESKFLVTKFGGSKYTTGKDEYLPIPQAQIDIQASNHSTYFTWSLSTTSGHLDDSRTISSYVAYSSASPPSIYPISRMTSVFSVTESTIIYMVGEFSDSTANENSKSYMNYTRLA